MTKCPIRGCTNNETEYFLSFIIERKNNDTSKSLWGCLCGKHAFEKKAEYEEMGRTIALQDEAELRERARLRKIEDDREWQRRNPENNNNI